MNALQTEYGIRLSALCELSYFSAIRFTIIDFMHNLYLGTAKRMIELWLELNIISEKQLKDIQARVDSVQTASDVGRVPDKIASCFGGLYSRSMEELDKLIFYICSAWHSSKGASRMLAIFCAGFAFIDI